MHRPTSHFVGASAFHRRLRPRKTNEVVVFEDLGYPISLANEGADGAAIVVGLVVEAAHGATRPRMGMVAVVDHEPLGRGDG